MNGKLAFCFPGQGSQEVGMGRAFAEAFPEARAVFAEASEEVGYDVGRVCFEGPIEDLTRTEVQQPALVATSVACLRAVETIGLKPDFVIGHSVGEYAALVAAGVLEFAAALRLVARRAALMARADAEGGMAAIIGLSREAVDRAVDAIGRPTELVVANDNAPGQVVISGSRVALEAAEAALRSSGARRVIRLPVSGAFHSPLMAGVAEELATAFESEPWRDASVPVVSNVTAEPLTDADRLRALLAEQVRSPVEWVRCVERMAADGVDTFVELGSGSALVGMVMRIVPDARAESVGDLTGLAAAETLVGSPAGASVS